MVTAMDANELTLEKINSMPPNVVSVATECRRVVEERVESDGGLDGDLGAEFGEGSRCGSGSDVGLQRMRTDEGR